MAVDVVQGVPDDDEAGARIAGTESAEGCEEIVPGPRPHPLDRLASAQLRRPWTFALVAYLLAALAVPLLLQLRLKPGFVSLLPSDKPSVRDLETAGSRIGGLSTLTVAVLSQDRDALPRFARDLVPRLSAIRGHGIRSVDWTVSAFADFVREHRELYADLKDLREVRDGLEDRLDYERSKANPLIVYMGDTPEDAEVLVDKLRKRAEAQRDKLSKFPSGFYLHQTRGLLAIFVRTDIEDGDADAAARLMAAVNQEVAALGPSRYAADLRVEYSGSLLMARDERDAMENELALATALTIILVQLSIYLFFWRHRANWILGLALVAPCVLTFGLAQPLVHNLNASTSFLGSIVIGNGINPFIIWLARYFEARRKGEEVEKALRTAHHGTWSATLVASLAAALSYAALIATDFRGFRDFGIIGGLGMVLCWIGTMTLLPALAVIGERVRPLLAGGEAPRAGFYGRVALRLIDLGPGRLVAAAAAIGLVCAVLVGMALRADPIEYNFRHLRSERFAGSRAREINGWVNEMLGNTNPDNGIVMLVPQRGDVAPLKAALEARRDNEGAPYGNVRTIDDLLPKDQTEKVSLVHEIRGLLLDARRYAHGKVLQDIDLNLPPESVRALTDADLPEEVARRFAERDGTRGRILYVENHKGSDIWDGRYLVQWAASLRQARLADGTRPPLTGRAPVFADMIETIWSNGPRATALALAAICVLVTLAFRSPGPRLLTLGALLLGVLCMAGAMALLHLRLNFLNFVAFPISFGIGVDYAVNIMRRTLLERETSSGKDAVRAAIRESGGAVVLCSLTTIIGYSSLLISANRALRSFGLAAAIGEVTCLSAAVLVLPALMLVLIRRREEAAAKLRKAGRVEGRLAGSGQWAPDGLSPRTSPFH
jgi:predicted RND superfamily exporter protein